MQSHRWVLRLTLRRMAVACVTFMAMLGDVSVCLAVVRAEQNYAIKEGAADKTLLEFARQSGEARVSVLFPSDVISQFTTNAIRGRYGADEALKLLLRGTGLAGSISPEGVAIITKSKADEEGTMRTKSKLGWVGGVVGVVFGQWFAPLPVHAAEQSTAQAASDAEVSLEEIVITSNKREERLQSVPASITAVTSDVMEKQQILEVKDIQRLAPSLNFQAGDEARLFNFSIRGVGSESFSVGVEPSVSTIVDGVVYTRPGAAFDGLGDLERVEVLNGPQGTLQGKNASAGAVSIVTKRPNRTAFEGKVEATIAEQNEHNVALTLSAPINDKWAYRFYGYEKAADGQVVNVANGKTLNNVKGYGFRGKLEFEPVTGVDLLLSADYTHRDSPCCAEPVRVASTATAGNGVNLTAAYTKAAIGPDSNQVNFDTVMDGSQKNSGISLEGNFAISDLTLTSVTAYRKFEDFAIRDRDGSNAKLSGVTAQQLFQATNPGISQAAAMTLMQNLLINPISLACRGDVCGENNNIEKNDTFTQELRLTSPAGGSFDYILGLYYYDSRVERDLTIGGIRTNIAGNVDFPSSGVVNVLRPTAYVLSDLVTKVDTVDKAVFGNFNFRPMDGLTLTAGFRALKDEIKWNHRKVTSPNGDMIGPATTGGANAGTPSWNFKRNFSDSTTIGKLSAKYEFTSDIMAYASWARGYKGLAVDADMFVTQAGYDALPAAPEKSRSWEVGLKSMYLNRRLTFNVTYYDTQFNGYQTASTGIDGSGAPVLRSAGQLFTKGWEVELALRPVAGLTLSANAELGSYEFGNLFVDSTTNLKGGVPLDAPETKWALNAIYDFNITNWGASLAANYSHTSETLFTNINDATKVPNNVFSPWIRPAYGVASMNFGLTSPSEKYRATLFVKNLFDDHYVASLRRISGSVGGGGVVAQAIPRDFNRYFGVTFAAKF